MKKLYIVMVFLTFFGSGAFAQSGAFTQSGAFADNGKQEEIDFLLFLPNSGNQFADDAQAMTHLDTVAHYLKSRNVLPGGIYVYGYAANVTNDIDPTRLSIDRALFVIQELQRRGIARNLFADPVGCGQVDLWGDNTGEPDRSPNRRVRILLEDIILTPALVAAESVTVIPPPEKPAEESRYSFPWWLLLLLLLPLLAIAAIIFFASRRKKNASANPTPVLAPKAEPQKEKIKVLGEDEIRRYAYGLYDRRHAQNGDAIGDWYKSISELTAHYEALGYRVILYWETEAQAIR